MKKKFAAAILAALLLFSGCGREKTEKYQATYLDIFDTVTTVIGYADSEEAFQAQADKLREELTVYHQLYDIYNDYPGLNNLKTINDNAGIAPVEVDEKIISLLQLCREFYAVSGGKENAALGSVLQLWHESREAGLENPEAAALPDSAALQSAAEHIDFNQVILDTETNTVFLPDADMRLDVGSVAKGFAVTAVCQNAPSGYLVSLGGNVYASGPRADGTAWNVGINDPEGGAVTYVLKITGGSVVTSGDYQRYYTVNGKNYHHIIDPDTLMPGEYWASVTIVHPDSGVADALSTALFLMTQEEGEALLEQYGAEALWLDHAGNAYMTDGLREILTEQG